MTSVCYLCRIPSLFFHDQFSNVQHFSTRPKPCPMSSMTFSKKKKKVHCKKREEGAEISNYNCKGFYWSLNARWLRYSLSWVRFWTVQFRVFFGRVSKIEACFRECSECTNGLKWPIVKSEQYVIVIFFYKCSNWSPMWNVTRFQPVWEAGADHRLLKLLMQWARRLIQPTLLGRSTRQKAGRRLRPTSPPPSFPRSPA